MTLYTDVIKCSEDTDGQFTNTTTTTAGVSLQDFSIHMQLDMEYVNNSIEFYLDTVKFYTDQGITVRTVILQMNLKLGLRANGSGIVTSTTSTTRYV